MHSCYVWTEKFSLLVASCSQTCFIFSTYPPFKPNAPDTAGPWTTCSASKSVIKGQRSKAVEVCRRMRVFACEVNC